MPDDTQLDRYAELIAVHGLNVQPGQLVNISTEPVHREFARRIAEQCYDRGARLVELTLADEHMTKLRVEKSIEEDLGYVPEYVTHKYRELVEKEAANLRLIGSEDPELLSSLDPRRMNTVQLSRRLAIKYFYDEGIGKSKVHWCVAAASTPKWGKKVYPDMNEDEAHEELWGDILRMCRADQKDCLAAWREHNVTLQSRARNMTELGIDELRFQGPGTDLRVGLSPRAVFKGGQEHSSRGQDFEPNLPTEEVFTTPDFRRTVGQVQTTRPFIINGKLVKGLRLAFQDGVITDFEADEGAETFGEYIKSDEGANRLGEVALVGIDSPVYQTGRIFQEILFDENAACHIAVGMAYKFCLEGGADLTSEEAKELGCNESSVHTDMMISSEEVDVTARTQAGHEVPLIKQGRWMENLAPS